MVFDLHSGSLETRFGQIMPIYGLQRRALLQFTIALNLFGKFKYGVKGALLSKLTVN